MSPRRRILLEVLLVYLGTIGTVKLLYELRFIPLIQQHVWTVAMVLQVYVPGMILFWRREDFSLYGLNLWGWKRGVLWWLALSVVVLAPAAYGHHLWQRWNGNNLSFSYERYRQFPEWLRGTPPTQKPASRVWLWSDRQGRRLFLRWRDALRGEIRSDGPLKVVRQQGGVRLVPQKNKKKILFYGSPTSGAMTLQLEMRGQKLSLQLTRRGKALPPGTIRAGPSQKKLSSLQLERGFGWLLLLLLAQIFVVALPEEFFYRGFLLTRLDEVWPAKIWQGIPLSWGNLLVSLLFALTHFLVGYHVYRLGVFFPSLLFGALRQRTRSLFVPILFHATANILMKLFEVSYR